MNNKLFVFDCEADGIYGNILSIAAKAVDSGEEISSFYGAVKITLDEIKTEWVRENVYEHLKNAEKQYETEDELLEAFWEFYASYAGEYEVVTDVPYPVETGVFGKCVSKDLENRQKYSPYPVYDLESMLAAKGRDKLEDRELLSGLKAARHDAMNDVDMIIKILENLGMIEKKDDSEKVYSYHTFLLPYIWKTSKRSKQKKYYSKLSEKNWKEYHVSYENMSERYGELQKPGPTSEDGSTAESDGKNEKEKYDLTLFQEHKIIQYFTESARRSILGEDKDYVKVFIYDNLSGKDEYVIENQGTTYKLDINGIKLKVYNTGIAILIFELENNRYRDIKSVKNINEWGRRLYPPYFLEGKNYFCPATAEKLGITDPDNSIKNLSTISGPGYKLPLSDNDCLPDFIKNMLPDDDKIKTAIDDRMFVCCSVTDPEYSKTAKTVKYLDLVNAEETEFPSNIARRRFIKRNNVLENAKSLYELIYIDREGDCSCLSNKTLEKLLKESVYDRWDEYGTYTMVSHHSLIFLSNGGVEHPLESFLLQTIQMATAVLAQRATINYFGSRVSEISSGFESQNVSFNKNKKLISLQKKYIAFLSQHMNIEITCQEQGIEIYNLLQKQLYVIEENEKLRKEIEMLSEAANTAQDLKISILALCATIILGIPAIYELIIRRLAIYEFLRFLFEQLLQK